MKKLIFTVLIAFCNFGVLAQSTSTTPIVVQVQSAEKETFDYILLIVQILGAIGLFLYVYKTWGIAAETKETRIQEIEPRVFIFMELAYGSDWIMSLVVKNTGKTIATNVKFQFEPPLMTSMGGNQEFKPYFLREGIKSLIPNQEVRTIFDETSTYRESGLPTTYKVTTSYFNTLRNKEVETEHTLDLSIFESLIALGERYKVTNTKTVDEMFSEFNELKKHSNENTVATTSDK